jgi:hypothetical protein
VILLAVVMSRLADHKNIDGLAARHARQFARSVSKSARRAEVFSKPLGLRNQ